MLVAHSAHRGSFEPELMVFGVTLLVLAFFLRPGSTGTTQQFLVTLVAGVALIVASVVLPRV